MIGNHQYVGIKVLRKRDSRKLIGHLPNEQIPGRYLLRPFAQQKGHLPAAAEKVNMVRPVLRYKGFGLFKGVIKEIFLHTDKDKEKNGNLSKSFRNSGNNDKKKSR